MVLPALILMTAANAEKRGIKPLARIVAHASHSQAPRMVYYCAC